MQFYPAIKAYMGDWIYFIVKMRMREVATEVQFGSQVHNDFTLDEAIQRTLNESRVKQELVAYLTGSDDRFFASLVVAAIGGSPKFFPVSITDDPSFKMIATTMEDSFGVLRFDGDQNYYALDGQHRLKAIKSLIHPDIEAGDQNPPKNFANEEISVLMVVRPSEARDDDWLISYRRLFSNLNRYAKPTDKDTNIIMDEDDAFAILTRRLISDHYFFQARGRQQDSHRVLTKGKSLKENTSHFTTLQQLYELNEKLLTTNPRTNAGWGPEDDQMVDNVKNFKRFRPSERYLCDLFWELKTYWDAIIDTIDDLEDLNPADARNHSADGSEGEIADNLLFWPIGQEVMIDCARFLLDEQLEDPSHPTPPEVATALEPLGKVDWRLHQAPWRGLLLKYGPTGRNLVRKWSMRNEDRKLAVNCAKKILRWLTDPADIPNQYDEDKLYKEWRGLMLLPEDDDLDDPDDPEILWHGVRAMRDRIRA